MEVAEKEAQCRLKNEMLEMADEIADEIIETAEEYNGTGTD